MAQQNNPILRDGVEAARRGDKLTARRLLQQVLNTDPNNEIALMWMASVVDSLSERQAYLERVLKINPANARAQEALARLGGTRPSTSEQYVAPATPVQERFGTTASRRGNNLYFTLAGIIAVLLIAFIVISLLQQSNNTPTQITQSELNATFQSIVSTETLPATLDPALTPTPTEFSGVIVTYEPNENALPPTYTSEPTAEPTSTLAPTATAFLMSSYEVVTISDPVGESRANAVLSNGTGENPRIPVEGSYQNFTISPDGSQAAFISLAPTSFESAQEGADAPGITPQIFVGPFSFTNFEIIEDAEPVTALDINAISGFSWSPDGSQIVFSANVNNQFDLYIVNIADRELTQLTNDSALDTQPSWSPDGLSILYASDLDSPTFLEIYQYTFETEQSQRLTDAPGNNYSPVWSPDGTRIAFLSDRGGDGDVYIMDANGQRSFLLTVDDSGAEDKSIAWTPDGEWIAFASNREYDNFAWYRVNPANNTIELMFANDRSQNSITFNPLAR